MASKENKIITEDEVIKCIESVRNIDYIFALDKDSRDFIKQSGPYVGAQYLAYKMLMKLLTLFPEEEAGITERGKEQNRFSNIGKVLK